MKDPDIECKFYVMHISLTDRLDQYVREQVASGLYSNVSEVIRDALRDKLEHKAQALNFDPVLGIPLETIRLNQVLVIVNDFEAALKFYQDLGLRLIVSERGEYARFETPLGTSTFSILLSSQANPSDTEIYFEVADVDATVAELRAQGLTFDSAPEDKPWLWCEASLRDPSGNRIVIYHGGENRRFPPWRIHAEGYETF